MTVKELIEQLQAAPPDSLVVLSKDSEGNAYRPLAEVEVVKDDDGGFDTSVWELWYAEDELDLGGPETIDDVERPNDVVSVVVLWPEETPRS